MVEVTKLVNVMLIFLTLFVVALSDDSKPFSSLFKSPLVYCLQHSDCQAYECELPFKPDCLMVEYSPQFVALRCGCV
ncbi:putative Late nodulin [Medicago truncatula]|uniref:Nodule Cysteine-Rich (NCR) secreted peptide n=1 Tax=Medicago truncatula TaxID=3880 RepID=A0A072TJN4_MEDTR|nr:Nodule Cysteine-Rich (NCR) secreted peptide [Medicago truncatula]RHN60010.1 putative Late nodulin [Medicago truncatula]